MANVVAVIETPQRGLNEQNIIIAKAQNGSIPNGDTLTATFTDLAGKGWAPHVNTYSLGAGAVGARTLTKTAGTVTWTYNETTGALVITNGSGGALLIVANIIFLPTLV